MPSSPKRSDPTTWGVSTLQLQRPDNLYFDGAVRPWDEGMLHVSTEAVVRGLNVFEGMKAYWQKPGGLAFRALGSHYARMKRSARLLHIPVEFSLEDFVGAITALAEVERTADNDLFMRATLLAIEGHHGEGTVADLVLTAYQQKMQPPKAIAVGTSTWQRNPDLALPVARVKTGSNYLVARLARIEGQSRGYEDMIVLNRWGRVAEGISACLVMVRDGTVSTPPPSEGALESITLHIIRQLAAEEGIPVVERPIDRSELYVADELALVGTLAEMTPISAIDDMALPTESPVCQRLRERYFAAVRGSSDHPAVEMTVVAVSPRTS
ncbi:MAG: aminotransferase class IV [Actinomycetota bacterium]|nr:aminotransferase class IV [Actinomycetota bacterium]